MAEDIKPVVREMNGLRFYGGVLWRTLLVLILCNFLFAAIYPMPSLGKLSAYNLLFPGRLRLPYGENPDREYNLSLFNLEAMFASHEIAGEVKPEGEYRLVLIGDSSTWGFLLPPGQTLAAYINEASLTLPDGRLVRAYNLGYPVMSLAKDLVILREAMAYDPDMVIWPITLESFPWDKQLSHPLLQNNPEKVRSLFSDYSLPLNLDSGELIEKPILMKTLIGMRRQLADLLRLQLYGVMWAATGIDHEVPLSYNLRQEDLPADASFHDLPGPPLDETDLAIEILSAGHQIAGKVPILLVNEPVFVSQGENSQIRYNFFYPRWAYDDYRNIMETIIKERGWFYLDAWDAIAPDEFTNTAIHMTPAGTQQFSQLLTPWIIKIASQNSESEGE